MSPTENQHPGTKEHHNYSRKDGYQTAEYEHSEYPKVVGYEADGKTPITAQNAEEEAKFKAAAAPLESTLEPAETKAE